MNACFQPRFQTNKKHNVIFDFIFVFLSKLTVLGLTLQIFRKIVMEEINSVLDTR